MKFETVAPIFLSAVSAMSLFVGEITEDLNPERTAAGMAWKAAALVFGIGGLLLLLHTFLKRNEKGPRPRNPCKTRI